VTGEVGRGSDLRRIVIVGAHPPPYGGNSTHALRLARRLALDGVAVTVVDPERRRTFLYQPGVQSQSSFESKSLTVKSGLWPAFFYLAWHSIRGIVHYHMSMGRRFFRLSGVLNAISAFASRRIVTIHSGSFVRELETLSEPNRQHALRVLGRFEDVICVSEEQKRFLEGKITSRLHTIPAYLPPPSLSQELVPPEVRSWRKTIDVMLVTSGSGHAVYDYLTILRGLERAQERLPLRLGLLLATYQHWDPVYWKSVEKVLKETPVSTLVTRDLEPDVFAKVLSLAHLYIRASLTDGDSIAIREAAAMGPRVVASDSVTRPAGCLLFATGNAEDLAMRIVAAVNDETLGKLPPRSCEDNYPALRVIYN
jgi:glycogen synthase